MYKSLLGTRGNWTDLENICSTPMVVYSLVSTGDCCGNVLSLNENSREFICKKGFSTPVSGEGKQSSSIHRWQIKSDLAGMQIIPKTMSIELKSMR